MLAGSSSEVEVIRKRAKPSRMGAQARPVRNNHRIHKWWMLSVSGDIVAHRKAVVYEKHQTVDRALPNLQLEWREIQRRRLSQEGQRESSQEPSGAQSTYPGNWRLRLRLFFTG